MNIDDALEVINNYDKQPVRLLIEACDVVLKQKGFSKISLPKVFRLIDKYDLKSKNRRPKFTLKRYYLMNYISINSTLTLENIGRIFNRDHSTVVHALRQHDVLMNYDFEYYMDNLGEMLEDVQKLTEDVQKLTEDV